MAICPICARPDCAQINKALVLPTETFAAMSKKLGVSAASLSRHRDAHIPVLARKAMERKKEREQRWREDISRELKDVERQENLQADDLLHHLLELHGRAVAVLTKAENKGDGRLALMAIREARETILVLGRFLGYVNATEVNFNTVNVTPIDAETAERVAKMYLLRHGDSETKEITAANDPTEPEPAETKDGSKVN